MAQSRLEKIGTIYSRFKVIFPDLSIRAFSTFPIIIIDQKSLIFTFSKKKPQCMIGSGKMGFRTITGIIRAGAMSLEDRPLWYEVYQAFPPVYPPRYDRPASNIPLRNIFYQEDVIRVKFHKKMDKNLPTISLLGSQPTATQKMLYLYEKNEREKSMTTDEAFASAFEVISAEAFSRKKFLPSSEKRTQQSLAASFQEALKNKPDKMSSVDVP